MQCYRCTFGGGRTGCILFLLTFPMSLRGDMPGKEQARCKIVQSTNESRRLYS